MKNRLFLKTLILFVFASAPIASAQVAENNKKEISNLLEKKRSYNISKGYGYCIQIYYGNEITAKKMDAQFSVLFPKIPTKLVYNNPEWKVQVGNYKTKLEADRVNLIFREKFSATIVVPMGK
ncbi:MAG: SPOR domain-containing protein [Polaribacter sp.]|uniref:SPOR domain-containing protein n=1 Tax=Polaribacter sp. TaxID=1920175 RepID=UPI000A4C919E|nr:SPOR domain-containing protein [Polaribacter sp.]|tara:strand:+ start:116 stop:484 length:369 start_codon:yes stop_codon:yes gene_type:complete